MSSVGTPTTTTTSAPGRKATTRTLSLTRKTQERHKRKQRLPRPLKNDRPLPLPQLRQQCLPCLLRNVRPQLRLPLRSSLAPRSHRRSKEPFRGDLLRPEQLLQPGEGGRLRNAPTDRLCQHREAASFYRRGRQCAGLRAGLIRQRSTTTPCIRPVLRRG